MARLAQRRSPGTSFPESGCILRGKRRGTDSEAEKLRIIQTAAELIKNDIKCTASPRDVYQTPGDIWNSLEQNSAFVL